MLTKLLGKLPQQQRALYRNIHRNVLNQLFHSRSLSDATENQNESIGLRACVVGAGPGGFYATKYLLKAIPNTKVDIVEQLPTPFGLVRYGVAPDHPEVKSVSNDFSDVAEDSRVRFCGNVRVGDMVSEHKGPTISVDQLRDWYDVVVFAYGAADDRSLGLSHEFDVKNIASARQFVNWYNAHPYHSQWQPDLKSGDTAIVVGQGNVAIDCARILTKSTSELATSDIASHALESLSQQNKIRKVVLLGRRGAVQAAFTMKELRELSKLEGVGLVVYPDELELGETDSSLEEASNTRALKRKREFLTKQASKFTEELAKPKVIELRFLWQPVEFLSNPDNDQVTGVKVERTSLVGPPGSQVAVPTGTFENFPCSIVLKSIGYKSVELPGLPFNTKNFVVNNVAGRVVDESGNHVQGLYASGWVKRGPTGIVGTNITDARETVESIVSDYARSASEEHSSKPAVDWDSLFPHAVVSWEDYKILDASELKSGEVARPPKLREKVSTVNEMLQIIKS